MASGKNYASAANVQLKKAASPYIETLLDAAGIPQADTVTRRAFTDFINRRWGIQQKKNDVLDDMIEGLSEANPDADYIPPVIPSFSLKLGPEELQVEWLTYFGRILREAGHPCTRNFYAPMFLPEGAIFEQKRLLNDARADETMKSLAYANMALKAVVLTDGFTQSKYTVGAFRFDRSGRLIGLKDDAVGARFADCAAAIQRNVAENRARNISRRTTSRKLLAVRKSLERSGVRALNAKTVRNRLAGLEQREQRGESMQLSRLQSVINSLRVPRNARNRQTLKKLRLGTIPERRGSNSRSTRSR